MFKDKPAAGATLWVSTATQHQRRLQRLSVTQASDAPVHQPYLDSLAARGFTVTAVSKWLNAAVVTATPEKAAPLRQTSFVQDLQPITGFFVPTRTAALPYQALYMGKALKQLKPEAIFAASLTGRGVKVGVIDAGFYDAPNKSGLQPIFGDGRLKAYRDFVNPAKTQPYSQRESLLDSHGTDVLLFMAGSDPERQVLSGFAPEAEFYLARTDHGNRETRVEEEYFVQALEWMDSLGVRLVNSSLGYGTGFDNPAENYIPEQMDGTSFIARAVQMAVEQKGMMLVIAAGNDGGNKKWRIVNTPADAPGVLTVGATDFTTWAKQGYSSIGPGFLPYLKPDVACFAASGTSFAAPIIAGLAACLLEEDPSLTPQQLTDIIKKSSHLYPYGNNYVGYGVPNAFKALELVQGFSTLWPAKETVTVEGNRFVYKHKPSLLTEENGGIVLYRKESPTVVMAQQRISLRKKRIVVKRKPKETHTTLHVGPTVVELVWE
ncbi:peptidase S8 [Rufibacter immobilis]|uniref:Peptidase S8 n=2 Tax=Rufibacter immobilis TaxID=1348778 RepID=A0A3M9N549_9BACT|nr:peptidase S8 [Rufibacter immobilis]